MCEVVVTVEGKERPIKKVSNLDPVKMLIYK